LGWVVLVDLCLGGLESSCFPFFHVDMKAIIDFVDISVLI